MVKIYEREHYKLKSYDNEVFKMEITNEETHISHTITSLNYEDLYMKAKEEAKKGNHVEIWEMRYEFVC